MMYCRYSLLLLTLFAVTVNCSVTSQDSDDPQCDAAARALVANRLCATAFELLDDHIDSNTPITMEILNVYCSPSCRPLNTRLLSACSDSGTDDATQLICTAYEGMSCYDVVATLLAAESSVERDIFELEIECDIESPTGSAQTCSPGCMTAVQNFLDAGGCCFVEALGFGEQSQLDSDDAASAERIVGLLSACPDFNNRTQSSCEVIIGSGGQAGSMSSAAVGNILIAAIIVVSLNLF